MGGARRGELDGSRARLRLRLQFLHATAQLQALDRAARALGVRGRVCSEGKPALHERSRRRAAGKPPCPAPGDNSPLSIPTRLSASGGPGSGLLGSSTARGTAAAQRARVALRDVRRGRQRDTTPGAARRCDGGLFGARTAGQGDARRAKLVRDGAEGCVSVTRTRAGAGGERDRGGRGEHRCDGSSARPRPRAFFWPTGWLGCSKLRDVRPGERWIWLGGRASLRRALADR